MRRMLWRGDKMPFIIRTVLVMLAIYIGLMLTATWCVKESFESGIDADEIWQDIRSDLKSCRSAAVDSAAYKDGFNQAQALAVLRYHRYRLYKQYEKYDGQVDIQLYHCSVKDDRISSIEKLSVETPVLIGAPYNRNSPIVVFADSFDEDQVEEISGLISEGRIGSYIDHVEGYKDGRFFYPTVLTTYEGMDEREITIHGHPDKRGKKIKYGSLQDFIVFLPDGNSYGKYGVEDKMSSDFAEECDEAFQRNNLGEIYSQSGFTSGVNTASWQMSTSEEIPTKQYAVNVNITFNAWLYALEKMPACYLLSALLMIALSAMLIAGHNGLIEDRFETERKRRFMADSMAHDMKTPISIIRSYAELLLKEGRQDKRQEYTETIISETETMNDAVVTLLDLSKMEAGTYPMDLSDFVLADVVRRNVNRCEALLAEKNMQAKIEVPEDLKVFADRKLISKAISNFISNGIRNGKEGTELIIAARNVGRSIRISVHDTGTAIADEEMKHLWDVYYQTESKKVNGEIHDGDSIPNPGSGLGLAIVRNICMLHGGTYGCANENDGVTFWIQISSQEGRIGTIDFLTGPVTGISETENPGRGIGLIAIGTLIQGLFWSFQFAGKLTGLMVLLAFSDAFVDMTILDPICLSAAGVGTGFILLGVRKLFQRGWPLRKDLAAGVLLLIGTLAAVCLSATALINTTNEQLGNESLILEVIVSFGMAIYLMSHYRLMVRITGKTGNLRRSRLLRRQEILTAIVICLFVFVSVGGMYLFLPHLLAGGEINLPYIVLGNIWLLICIYSSANWIIAGKHIAPSSGKIDISKYKREDITNISKEETPIVKALNKRQTAGFVCGFVLFFLCGVNAYFYNEIGRVPATVIEIILVAALVFFIIYSVRIGVKLSKIKKWQVSELYQRIREGESKDQYSDENEEGKRDNEKPTE